MWILDAGIPTAAASFTGNFHDLATYFAELNKLKLWSFSVICLARWIQWVHIAFVAMTSSASAVHQPVQTKAQYPCIHVTYIHIIYTYIYTSIEYDRSIITALCTEHKTARCSRDLRQILVRLANPKYCNCRRKCRLGATLATLCISLMHCSSWSEADPERHWNEMGRLHT